MEVVFKINVGIREDGKKILFITNTKEENIGEIEISDKCYEICLKEFSEEES